VLDKEAIHKASIRFIPIPIYKNPLTKLA